MKLEVKLSLIREPWKQQKPRIYFWPEGESILENLANRRNRPYTEYRRYLDDVLRLASKMAERNYLADAKANWSKHAGCTMCPCSPGFVLSGPNVDLFGYDIHVTISQDSVAPVTTS